MRSNMLHKRSLDSSLAGKWNKNQEVEELDLPGNKSTVPAKPEVSKDATKTADWMGDLIKQTVQWLTQHKSDASVAQDIAKLPIASRVGPAALQGPVHNFVNSGNAVQLSNELEMLLQKRRSVASKNKQAEEAPVVEAPKKEKTEGEQPEKFEDAKRPEPTEEKAPEPSADNSEQGGARRRIKLDEHTSPSTTPTTWSVDNTREQPHKASKKNATPTSWSVDNTRSLPTEESEMTTEEQMVDKKKNGSLEIYEPKTAAEIEEIVASSDSWVGQRLATGVMTGGSPRFLINATSAVAVISAQGDVFDGGDRPTGKFASVLKKIAAAGGASEEPETEEQTSVDSVVVQLLEACKVEWTSLGEPVNPGTWPKEIERAILALNDDLVAAIQKVEDKLVEGEFYSKNVDEGVEGHGGSMVNDLNIAPAEGESDVLPPVEGETVDMDAELEEAGADKLSSKTATDIGVTETRKALKHTQSLKDDIASKFFEFKKVVQNANDSALVKNVAEVMVGLKVKLEEVEKVLDKQLDVFETADTAIEEKNKDKKASDKSALLLADGGSKCSDCGKDFMHSAYGKGPEKPVCPDCVEKGDTKEAASKTAACPTCGSKVLQGGVDTNGVSCPNCAGKTAPQNGQQQTQRPVPSSQAQTVVKPAAVSPVKQYGSLKSLASLTIAGAE